MAGILWDIKAPQIKSNLDGVEATGVYKGVLKEDMIDTICRVRRPFINVFIDSVFFEEADWPLTYVPMHDMVLPLKKDQEVWVRFDQGNARYPVLHKLVDHLDSKPTDEYIAKASSGEEESDSESPPPALEDASTNIIQVDAAGLVALDANTEAEKEYNKDMVLVNETEESPDPNDEGEEGILVRFPLATQTKEVYKLSDDYWIIISDEYCLIHRGAQAICMTVDTIFTRADNLASLAVVSDKHEVQGTYNQHIHGPVSKVFDDTYNEHFYGAITRKYEQTVTDVFVSDWDQTWEANVNRTYQGTLTEVVEKAVTQTYNDAWTLEVAKAVTQTFKDALTQEVTKAVTQTFKDAYNLTVTKAIAIEGKNTLAIKSAQAANWESSGGKTSFKAMGIDLGAELKDIFQGLASTAPTTMGSPAAQNFNPGIVAKLIAIVTKLGMSFG